MTDVLTAAQRRLNMSRIRGRDTKPEMLIRQGLHARGFRYRLHVSNLPGRPDLIFPKYRTIIFVHGCFWHGHDCAMFHLPSTRVEFWSSKINANRQRDKKSCTALLEQGWRVLIIWECVLRGPSRLPIEQVLDFCSSFICGDKKEIGFENLPNLDEAI
jgi:DNA mismatch endonuclease, patch repair protein